MPLRMANGNGGVVILISTGEPGCEHGCQDTGVATGFYQYVGADP
jgi:hypothetical protein